MSVHPEPTLIGRVELGPEVSVWPQAVLRTDFGDIRVSARTSIQDGTVLRTTAQHPTAQHPTVIGADCVVGHLAHLEGCTVGDRCLIGSNLVVLDRVVNGDGSLVGAGTLVPEDTVVPPRPRSPRRARPGAARRGRRSGGSTVVDARTPIPHPRDTSRQPTGRPVSVCAVFGLL